MRRRFARTAVASLSLALVTCTKNDENCWRSCRQMSGCGMLPSPLGQDYDNCVRRCTFSDKKRLFISDPDAPMGWCAGNRVTPDGCARLQHSLFSLDPDGALAGVSDVEVVVDDDLGRSTGEAISSSVASASNVACHAQECTDRSGRMSLQDAKDYCDERGFAAVNIALIHDSGVTRRSVPCATALSRPTVFVRVPTGRTQAVLTFRSAQTAGGEVFATADNGAGGTGGSVASMESCMVTAGDEVAVLAKSRCNRVRGLLPEEARHVAECEQGPGPCSDEKDNDRDGFTDCDDIKCQAVCEVLPPESDGGAGGDASR